MKLEIFVKNIENKEQGFVYKNWMKICGLKYIRYSNFIESWIKVIYYYKLWGVFVFYYRVF